MLSPSPTTVRSNPSLASMGVVLGGFALTLVAMGAYGSLPRAPVLINAVLILIQVGLLVYLIARRRQLGSHFGYLMMLFGLCYWFVLPSLVFGFNSSRSIGDRYGLTVTQRAIAGACVALAIFHVTSVISYWISLDILTRRAKEWRVPERNAHFYLMLVGLFLMGFLPFLLYGGTWREILQQLLQGRSATPDWKAAGALGDQRSALYYLCVSGFVAAGGFAGTWALLSTDRFLRKTLIAMYLIAGIVVFLDGGTRSWIALAWVPTILAFIAATMKHHLTLGRMALCLLAIGTVQLVFECARAWRSVGWSFDRIITTDLSKLHFDNDFFTDLAVSKDLVPNRQPYFGFGDVTAFLSHPVPRFLWKEKPISPILIYYNSKVYHGYLRNHGNKLPSHIGQSHMSFGTPGILVLAVVTGLIAACASVLMASDAIGREHLGALLAIWWFLMARGIYAGWTYPLLFVLLILFLGFRYRPVEQVA